MLQDIIVSFLLNLFSKMLKLCFTKPHIQRCIMGIYGNAIYGLRRQVIYDKRPFFSITYNTVFRKRIYNTILFGLKDDLVYCLVVQYCSWSTKYPRKLVSCDWGKVWNFIFVLRFLRQRINATCMRCIQYVHGHMVSSNTKPMFQGTKTRVVVEDPLKSRKYQNPVSRWLDKYLS